MGILVNSRGQRNVRRREVSVSPVVVGTTISDGFAGTMVPVVNPHRIAPATTPIVRLVRPFQEFAGRENLGRYPAVGLHPSGFRLGQLTLGALLHGFVAYAAQSGVGRFQFEQRASLLGERCAHGRVLLRRGVGKSSGNCWPGSWLLRVRPRFLFWRHWAASWFRPFCTFSSTQTGRALAVRASRWPPILHSPLE
jgi:hypothetical protein